MKIFDIFKSTEDNNKNDDLEVDGNSEEQSVTKYSQRNDGIIDINALEHKETPDYRIENGSKMRIILKTKNNDIYSAEVMFDCPFALSAKTSNGINLL